MSDLPPNRQFVVLAVTLVCLVLSLVAICVRLFSKRVLTKKIAADDYHAIVAFIFLVGQSAAVLAASRLGFGQSPDRHYYSSPSYYDGSLYIDYIPHSEAIEKGVFAAFVLYFPAMMFARRSLFAFVKPLTPSKNLAGFGSFVAFLTILWGIFGTVITCTMCAPWEPWKFDSHDYSLDGGPYPDNCLEARQFPVSIAFDIVGALSDLELIVWPYTVVCQLSMSHKNRIVSILAFASRLIVVLAVVPRLVVTGQILKTKEWAYDAWSPIVCTQIVLALNFITACVPCVGPVLEGLIAATAPSHDPVSTTADQATGHGEEVVQAQDSTVHETKS